ncbi:MAG: protein kinase [Gemmatimonadota bacterium]
MTEPHALLGSILNERYRVLEMVGRGGAATVLKAQDIKHGRLVAVKLMRGDLSHFGGADRFAREIAILATLQHPHILSLLDSGVIDEQPYYVMPFVAGESLRERLSREQRLSVQDAVRLILEVCDALRYAHEFGIVHRDVKPENILISGRHALVADFGVARTTAVGDSDGRYTTAGIALGTPTYMAPEQAAADPSVDHRADLYAVGILMYEMLTGQPPFAGEAPAQVLALHMTQMPVSPDVVRPDLPPSLAKIVMRCLAKRPDDRWPSAASLAAELEQFLLPSGAITPVRTTALAAMSPKRRFLWGALTVVVLLVAAGFWFNRTAPLQITVGTTRRLSAGEELELDPVLSPDGKLLAFAAGLNGAMRIYVRQLDGGDPVALADAVGGNQRRPQWTRDGSRVAFQANGSLYQAAPLGGRVDALVEGSPGTSAENLAFSPDGRSMAYTQAGEIRIRPIAGSEQPTILIQDGAAHSLAWSPNGSALAYVSGNRDFSLSETLLGNIAPSVIKIVARAGGAARQVTDGTSLAVSPTWWDERTLLYISNRDGIRDLYAQSVSGSRRPRGRAQRLTTGLNAHSIQLTADRRRVAVGALDQVSNIWAVSIPPTGAVSVRAAETVTSGGQVIEDLDVLPGAGWLLFDSNVNGNQDIYLKSLTSGRPIQLSHDSTDEFGPTWSPNGKEIAYYAVRGGVRHVFVMRSTGRSVRQVTTDSLGDHQPHWSPDGNQLVFYRRDGRGADHIYVVGRGPDSVWGAPRKLTEEVGTGATWSRDGRWIAFSDSAGRIRIIPPDGGRARVIATPAQAGGLRLERPEWAPFEPIVYARTEKPGGQGGIWRLGIDGTDPVEVVLFDDPARPVFRNDFATDGQKLFFTVSMFEGSLWLIDLTGG